MRDFIQSHDIKIKKRRLLISAMAAKDFLVSTALLKWYLQRGLVVTKIHQLIEFVPTSPFIGFVNDITHHRQMADKDPNKKIIALNKKLTGNSSYGSLILDKQKYTKTKNIRGLSKARMAVNQSNFKSVTELGDDYYQLDVVPARIRFDLPLYLGVHILLHAKLRMLEFVWDFLDKYLTPSKWNIGQMDTDSIYCGITEVKLTDAVKPELKAEFEMILHHRCTTSAHKNAFIPRECCDHHTWLDSKTPNLFKLEWSGHRLISLNSKTYCGTDNEGQIKLSCKGVNAQVVKRQDPITKYKTVLETRVSETGVNRGFRVDGVGVRTYTQTRQAFSYVYLKRQLEDDGIHSRPLNVVLNPVPVKYFCLQVEGELLAPDHKKIFRVFGRQFKTIRQAYAFMSVIHSTAQTQNLTLQNEISQTTDPKELTILSKKARSSSLWYSAKHTILHQIVEKRMSQIPNTHEILHESGQKTIVNACGFDGWFGVKYNARVVRWITDGYLCGQNALGEIYQNIRDK